ncbi:hypothetical protein [Desulfosporosinus sp. FKA]|uniref:hypothetical protein n=1 Tax=Desulfosporosinus sp. FKA TaxID=1969834 RepID=UPI000B4A3DAB|nr:hypothetical protein [Desulfosporosinus sp. FKA]
MDQELILKNNYPTQYNLFGIYVDWQIDNNYIGFLGPDPHGIDDFSKFLDKNRWQVVTIDFEGQQMLSFNLNLPKFKLLEILDIKIVKVNRNKLTGQEALRILEGREKKFKLPVFDIFQCYMANVPADLSNHKVFESG